MLQYIVDNTGLVDRELSVRAIWSFVVSLWTHKVQLLRATWPLLLPVLGFVAFVLKTGSIVLGMLLCVTVCEIASPQLCQIFAFYCLCIA